MEPAPRMRPAAGQRDGSFSILGKRAICLIAVALERAVKAHRNDLLQASGCTTNLPVKDDISIRFCRCPEIALACAATTGGQITNRSFIHLHVTSGHDSRAHLLIDGS